MGRRTFLGAAAATGLLAFADLTAFPVARASAASHPNALHTVAELADVKAKIAAGTDPWLSGFAKLTANDHSSSTVSSPAGVARVDRGGDLDNYGNLYVAAACAYQNALRWNLAGTDANGAKAAAILNDWSSTLEELSGSGDVYLLAGLQGAQLAAAADLVLGRSDFDFSACSSMLLNIFYPMNSDFLVNHNSAYVTNYWSSWDILTMNSVMAIGALTENSDLITQAANYYRSGAGNGAIANATQATPIDDEVSGDQGLVQWNEAGRDQGHALLGIGLMGEFCEIAWHQGIDLYGYDDNRFYKAAQYVAKYNLGNEVAYTTYVQAEGSPGIWSGSETCTSTSTSSRGQLRPIWERIYGHYHGRKGLEAKWIGQMAAAVRPEGGGGDYGSDSGGYDQLGFGTVAAYR